MCGRFTGHASTALRQFVEFVNLPNIELRYIITPGQPVSLIRGEHEARLDPVQWGLVPGWARADYMRAPARDHKSMRAETVQTKPSFKMCCRRRAVAGGRVLRMGTKSGQPYLIRQRTRGHFLWQRFGRSGQGRMAVKWKAVRW